MDSAWFDFGDLDAHGNYDTVDCLDGVFRLFFPPGHCFLEVLVEGFQLHRGKLEAFEPFLVVRFRQ